jgi:hypothetical protein
LVLPVVLSACTTYGRHAESAAIDQATSSARETAAHVQQSLLAELRTQPLADTLKSLPDSFPSGVVTVVDSSHDSAGGFTARLAIIGSGEGSGGSFQAQAAVRLCVSYSGVTGPNDRVDVADADCPAGLPTSVNGMQVGPNVTLGK